jgi:hypothetical protein
MKSTWQNAGDSLRSKADLERMTKVTNHPSLKRIRTKLAVETIALMVILPLYKDWFDGDKKPLFANVLLLGGALLYILNDVIGYISIATPMRGKNLAASIRNYLARIKRLSVLSLITSFLYGASLTIFFASVINFTKEKYLILAGIIIALVVSIYLSFRTWNRWIKNLEQQVTDLNLSEG